MQKGMKSMDLKLFEYFLNTQGVWAILFVFTFLTILINNAKREKDRKDELKEFKDDLANDIKLIHANMTFVVTTLKIVLEKELKRRKDQ
jgi:BhlA-like holin